MRDQGEITRDQKVQVKTPIAALGMRKNKLFVEHDGL